MKIEFKWFGFKTPKGKWRPLFWHSPMIRDCEGYAHPMDKEVQGSDKCKDAISGFLFGPIGIIVSKKCDHPKFK